MAYQDVNDSEDDVEEVKVPIHKNHQESHSKNNNQS